MKFVFPLVLFSLVYFCSLLQYVFGLLFCAFNGHPSSDSVTLKVPNGLVKTESDFIVRSVETGLGRWVLMVAKISVDACPFFFFFCFLRPDLPPWGYRNKCFLVALCHLIVRRPNLQVGNKSLFHQQVKTR